MKTSVLKVFFVIVCVALWPSSLQLEAQGISKGQASVEISSILELISVYEYDQSRAWLQEFQDVMKQVYDNPDLMPETEGLMLDVLQSDASLAGKHMICTELGIIGSEASVPVLVKMMSEPGMSGAALFALGKIPGALADEALRTALRKSDDKMKVAVLNTLAVRKDEGSVKQIRKLIGHSDERLAGAAIDALGTIGSPDCADILEKLFQKSTGEQKWRVLASWMKCEGLSGPNYLQVFEANPPPSLKYAALKGMFVASDEDPGDFIAAHLKEGDPAFHRQVISLVYLIPDPKNLGRIFTEVPSLPALSRLFLLSVLADVGDFSVRPEIMNAMKDEDPFTRVAALKALPGVGLASDASLLAGIASAARGSERETARQSLNILSAPHTNDSIRVAIETTGGKKKAELVLSTGERNITEAIPLLFTSASDPDQSVRTEAIRALGKIAPPDALPQLIELLVRVPSRRERMEAERTVLAVTQKLPDGSDRSGEIIKALSAGTDQASTKSMISILGQISDPKDLPILLEYLASEEDEIQLASIKALTDWPDASPLPDLLHIVQSTGDQVKHTLSLRASVEVLVSDPNMDSSDKLKMIGAALDLALNAAEKKIVISGLSRINSIEALDMALKHLSEEGLRSEMEAAVLSIADKTGWGSPGETRERLLIFLEMTENKDHKANANRIMERIKANS